MDPYNKGVQEGKDMDLRITYVWMSLELLQDNLKIERRHEMMIIFTAFQVLPKDIHRITTQNIKKKLAN